MVALVPQVGSLNRTIGNDHVEELLNCVCYSNFEAWNCYLRAFGYLPPCAFMQVQAGIKNEIGQIEPSGIHMIYLPYSDDIRHIEKVLL
jgi:hypothetical protein